MNEQTIKKIIKNGVVASMALLSVSTTAYGATKLIGSMQPSNLEVADVKTAEELEAPQSDIALANADENTEAALVTENQGSGKLTSAQTGGPTTALQEAQNQNLQAAVQSVQSQTQQAANGTTPTNKCIITIQGNQYDVTSLRNSHPGGDVFVCGTDMTSKYQGAHGGNLARMAPYLVSAAGGQAPAASGTGSQSSDDDEHEIESEDEDDEMEKEFEKAKKEYEDSEDKEEHEDEDESEHEEEDKDNEGSEDSH